MRVGGQILQRYGQVTGRESLQGYANNYSVFCIGLRNFPVCRGFCHEFQQSFNGNGTTRSGR